MTTDIPILIPIKGYSERCNRKNHALLPYTARYIHNLELSQSTTVITDSIELMKLAENLGLNVFLEIREPNQDELKSCWNFANANDIELFLLCPATQPFRSENLMKEMLQLIDKGIGGLDFITTISKVQNRSIFFLNKKNGEYSFKFVTRNRKGSNCNTELMIDGTLYLIKTEFLKKVIHSPDPNEYFWNGNFSCVENEAPFMDIDTRNDMQQFEFLRQYFKEEIPYFNYL